MFQGGAKKFWQKVCVTVTPENPHVLGGWNITAADAAQASQRSAMRYDREGDEHYDLLSALQKSIRGSDPDAAVYYLGRLLEAGDPLSPCRRLLVMAAEDVGLAYPQAMAVTKACVDAARELGLPEALGDASYYEYGDNKTEQAARRYWEDIKKN